MYTVVSLTKNVYEECLSGGNCSYIVRLSVRDLHGPTLTIMRNLIKLMHSVFFSVIFPHFLLHSKISYEYSWNTMSFRRGREVTSENITTQVRVSLQLL